MEPLLHEFELKEYLQIADFTFGPREEMTQALKFQLVFGFGVFLL